MLNNLRNNGTLHKVHLWTDISIGLFALFGLITFLFGIDEVLEVFFNVDLVFHIVIVIMVFGGIVAERIFHGGTHKGMNLH